MRKAGIIIAAVLFLATACGDSSETDNKLHNEGGEQVKEPVLNSGPETEQERATDAVSDSAIDNDSARQKP